jgi:23S rRNA-/tRNA-specific pseudouridylate synthase
VRGRPREKLWVVRPGDGSSVVEIVRRAGEDAKAIGEGRVFIGKKRATRADQPVRAGDTVRIGPAAAAGAHEAPPQIEILFQEDGLVACVKPAGLPTVPDHAGAAHSLVALIAKQLGAMKADDLRVTSRLDRDVSGVVVFALDADAEDRLRRARDEGRYQRRYVALAATTTTRALDAEGIWTAPIGRATDPRLRAARGPDAKDATTRWRSLASTSLDPTTTVVMLAVDPVTGRTHQIRVHASDAGAPLLGDRDYGGLTKIVLGNGRVLTPSRIALHAARVIVPGAHRLLEARAPIPDELARIWTSLGGAPDAWERALSSETPAPSRTAGPPH